MSPSKTHNKPMSNPKSAQPDLSPRPPVGAPAQETVGLYPQPYPLADARGQRSRKKTRSAVPGVEADARGQRSRKKTRSATPGVEADARGHLPRKKTRPGGRGERSRDRRHRRRSLAFAAIAGPSLPRLSPDSRDREGEIALLRSLTNRLLSKRPLDHVQISRYLRILVRAISADSRMPRELTNQEQVDNLIKKVFHKSINDGNLNFYDLVPVRMARPGEKWWPWRQLLPLEFRWRHGIIDPEERWPHEENKHLAEIEAMDRAMAEAYLDGPLDEDENPDEDPPSDYDPPPYEDPTPYDDDPPTDDPLSVIPAPEPVEDAESAPLACAERRESIPRNEADPPTRAPHRKSPPTLTPLKATITECHLRNILNRVIPAAEIRSKMRRGVNPSPGGAAHPEPRRRIERGVVSDCQSVGVVPTLNRVPSPLLFRGPARNLV